MNSLVIGTRGSMLALFQAGQVRRRIETVTGRVAEIKVVKTEGDQDRTTPLAQFGGRGAFVTALEEALEAGRIDLAVHSLKDLPSQVPPGFVLGAAPVREDARDVLISRGGDAFADLAADAVIGTGSIRRRMQAAAWRTDLIFTDIRGNIETRVAKMNAGDCDALILAAAGLNRLGWSAMATEFLPIDRMVPAPGQGAIGIECREERADVRELLAVIDDPAVRRAVDAERRFIAILGLGCHAPVGAYAEPDGDGMLFHAMAGRDDGSLIRETLHTSPDDLMPKVEALAEEFRRVLDRATE